MSAIQQIDEKIASSMEVVKKRTAYVVSAEAALGDLAAAEKFADEFFDPKKLIVNSDGMVVHPRKDGTDESPDQYVARKIKKVRNMVNSVQSRKAAEADEASAALDACSGPYWAKAQGDLVRANGEHKAAELLASRGMKLGSPKVLGIPAKAKTEDVKPDVKASAYADTNVYRWPQGSRRDEAIAKLISRQATLATRLAAAAGCQISGKPMR